MFKMRKVSKISKFRSNVEKNYTVILKEYIF